MIGILDRAYTRSKKGLTHEDVDWKPEVSYFGSSRHVWYCFAPKNVTRKASIREGILPQDGKVVVYTISSLNLIVPDVEKTRNGLREVYEDATSRLNEDLKCYKEVSVMGVSLGNVLSTRLASNLSDRKIKNLVSLIGGSRLGFSAWDSIKTLNTAQNSGCKTVFEYEAALEEFSPINHLPRISAQRVFARFGASDLMIRYSPHGRELRKALASMNADEKDIRTYPFMDHCSMIMLLGFLGIRNSLK